MVLVIRDEAGVELGRIGAGATSDSMRWTETLYISEGGRQLTPKHGDRYLRALAREFKSPQAQPFLE